MYMVLREPVLYNTLLQWVEGRGGGTFVIPINIILP